MTERFPSAERFWQRKESSVAEAGHAAVFRNGIVVFEVFIPSSLRFQRNKTTITPPSRAFSHFS